MEKVSTLAGIIIIIAVAAVLFGGVFAYQYFTKSQTAGLPVQINQATEGWKTYTNNNYNFSINYSPYFSNEIHYNYDNATGGSLEDGVILSSADTFNVNQYDDAAKLGITGIGADMISPLYSIVVWDGAFYSIKVAPWVDPLLCQQMKNDPTMPVILAKEKIGDNNFCVIDDATGYFLRTARSTKNNPASLAGLVGSNIQIDYIAFNSNNQPVTISFKNGDFGYRLARVILNGGNVENEITKLENELSARKKIAEQIISTFKFTIPSVQTDGWKTYINSEYGFQITFPDSWKGYSVVKQDWQGSENVEGGKTYNGPQIVIKNPKTTATQAWQDIPIMVFTSEQWNLIEQAKIVVSAAPIGPGKVGENQNYIFATPPRWWGFTDALGGDEAVNIVKTFKAF